MSEQNMTKEELEAAHEDAKEASNAALKQLQTLAGGPVPQEIISALITDEMIDFLVPKGSSERLKFDTRVYKRLAEWAGEQETEMRKHLIAQAGQQSGGIVVPMGKRQ